jgi:hypothetical protein
MTTKGSNNSYLNKKLGDMNHIPPFPIEIDDKVIPVVVINPSFYPTVVSNQYRGYPKLIAVDVLTTGIGIDSTFYYIPDGHYYRLLGYELLLMSGSATLTTLRIFIGDTVTNEILVASVTTVPSVNFTNFPMGVELPEVWYFRLESTISAEVSPATYRLMLLVQEWTTEDQKTQNREGLF